VATDTEHALAGGIVERVDALRSDAIELLAELVAIDSTNPSFPGADRTRVLGGETRCNEVLWQRYEQAGLELSWIARDPERKNLVGLRRGEGGGPSLVLNGHVDTVAPADPERWLAGSPWCPEIRDGWLYGLGAADMKAGVVAIWAAIQALQDADLRLQGDVLVHSVVGEETMEHELGTSACLAAGAGVDAAIVAEPTSLETPMMVTGIAGGYWSLRITVEGKSTHCANRSRSIRPGGLGDAVGVNALEKAVKIVQVLQELETQWGLTKSHGSCAPGAFTIMPGRLHADAAFEGPAPVYFPDRAVIEYSIVYPPDEPAEQPIREIEAYVLTACSLDPWLRDHPPTFEWLINWPPLDTSWDEPIVGALVRARETVLGERQPRPSPRHPIDFVQQDGTWYQRAGIPAVCLGPGAIAVAHGRDERVRLDEVTAAAKCFALCALDWCGSSDH
jgi:acetylornithine deacetylase/succinyl-diaminopimelate desuccinylase-like protein